MNKSTERRIKAIEAMVTPISDKQTMLVIEHPDGTTTCPDGSETSIQEDRMVIRVTAVEAYEGQGFTEDELEAKYPGRRDRLAKWEAERRGSE